MTVTHKYPMPTVSFDLTTSALQIDLRTLTGRKPRFYKYDIVYGYLRPYLNKVWVAEFDGVCSVDQYVYEVDSAKADPEFVASFMRSPRYLDHAPVSAGPGQLPRIRLEEVAAAEIDLPRDLNEQRNRVAALRTQMAVVERGRAAAETQLKAARALSASHLRSLFEKGRVNGWPKKRLADTCKLLPSKSIARDGDTVVRAITTACLSEDGFRPEGLKPARMWAQDAKTCIVQRGEILVARSNTTELVGRASMFDGYSEDVVASDLTIRIEAGRDFHPQFVAAWLSFLYVTGHWRERAGGASGSMKKITRTQLEDQLLPVPDSNEQGQIMRQLSMSFTEAERIGRVVGDQIRIIDAARAALLRETFMSELIS